jgi:hypothetical protein
MKKLRITGRRQKCFLDALAESGSVTLAAKAAGVSWSGVDGHRKLEDAFAKAWDEDEQVAADRLEAEARRRGVDGVSEPLVQRRQARRRRGWQAAVHSALLGSVVARAAPCAQARQIQTRERSAAELDISDRLADRLEAARRRSIAKPGSGIGPEGPGSRVTSKTSSSTPSRASHTTRSGSCGSHIRGRAGN